MPTVCTRNFILMVKSLGNARDRRETGLFKAEGTKCVADTLGHFALRHLCATDQWLAANRPDADPALIVKCRAADLERMSSLSTAPAVIAVYAIPEPVAPAPPAPGELMIALDGLQNPGNMGTIMRVADWYGIERIVCSRGTVDIYNPKTVQATMGAISRVKVAYVDLPDYLAAAGCEVYGTFLDGDNIYTASPAIEGIIVVGNEGRGVSDEVARRVTRRITIPSFPPDRPTSESLNAAVATAITVSLFRQPLYGKER